MSDRGDTREQPSIPDPGGLCAEHVFLGVAVASLTAAVLALIVEQETGVQLLRGGYSVLAALIVVGFTGWAVGSAARRLRREFGGTVAELTAALAELRAQARQPRVIYLPAPGRRVGHMYVSSAGQHEPAEDGTDPAGRSVYWQAYADVLEDLSGIEGEARSGS